MKTVQKRCSYKNDVRIKIVTDFVEQNSITWLHMQVIIIMNPTL
jgi:hypothetical protein